MMRPLVLMLLISAPALAERTPKPALLAPEPGCEAPALAAAERREVDDTDLPPPFRLAVLSCARAGEGPPKRPLRRT